MRPYEVVIIFDADLEEESIRSALDRSQEQIQQAGGEVDDVEHWGKRRFAYELKHRWEGYFVVVKAQAEPAAMQELDRSLSLVDDVLRHRVVRIPERALAKQATEGGAEA